MSSTSAGYGLRPVRRQDGTAYAGASDTYLLDPAGVAQNIGFGSVVELHTDGFINIAAGTGADATTHNLGGNTIGAIGVFVGCEYINDQNQPTFSQYYPSGALNAKAYVVTDPNVLFQAQANGAVTQTDLNHNIDFPAAQHATTSVDTTTGNSTMQVNSTTATATKAFKIVGFVTKPGSAIGDAYTDLLIKINLPYHAYGTGIVSN